jgi:hypothetical protein
MAWAVTAVKAHPELIHQCKYSLYLDRADKFLRGSYLDRLERVFHPPMNALSKIKKVKTGEIERDGRYHINTYNSVEQPDVDYTYNNYVYGMLDVIMMLTLQFGASGDNNFIQQADERLLCNMPPIHRCVFQRIQTNTPDSPDNILDYLITLFPEAVKDRLIPRYKTTINFRLLNGVIVGKDDDNKPVVWPGEE